jgi:PKD repeat protein
MSSIHRWRTLALAALWVTAFAHGALQAQFNDNGWITQWLLYGPLMQNGGPNPAVDQMRLDYLADGEDNFESTILPSTATDLTPDFLGASASDGYHAALGVEPAVFQEIDSATFPTPSDTIDFNRVYGGDALTPAEQAIVYGFAYINNATGGDIAARVQVGSDDSIQVKLDDCEILVRSIGRGISAENTFQDEANVTIPPGAHRLMVKVFNGVGGYSFRLRLVNAANGQPITEDSTPGIGFSLDPATFAIGPLTPVGLAVSHTVSPDRLVGFDKASTVTLSAVKLFPDLDDGTQVTVKEVLPAEMDLVAGSAAPAPTSVEGKTLTWRIAVGDLVATGITFDAKFNRPGAGTIAGSFSVGAGAGCLSQITGSGAVVAVALNAIFLGDIVGGGDGTGTKPAQLGGVRLDQDGWLLATAIPQGAPENNNSFDVDAEPFQEITADGHDDFPELDLSTAAELIDGTFFINVPGAIQINGAGVQFPFAAGEDNPNSWNHILANVTHDTDKGVGNILVRGITNSFATGIGVHASAGVTFDLDALRREYGEDKVVYLLGTIGTDTCGGPLINNYIFYSTDDEVLTDYNFMKQYPTEPATDYRELIPPDAKYVTFATGDANNGIGCDHGVFAEMRITGELPEARITANPATGEAPLAVNFSGAGSTTPPGTTIASYKWSFGDGESGEGQTVSHTYQDRGKYTVTLNIETSDFQTATTSSTVEATFACGDVSPLTSADVGAPAVAGCGRKDGEGLVVFGGGREILQRSDQFQFVYKSLEGTTPDTAFATARLAGVVLDGATNLRSGLMFRSSTAAGSAYAFVNVTPSLTGGYRAALSTRAETDATARSVGGLTLNLPNVWLKIERNGDEFIASGSETGQEPYTEIGRASLTAAPATMLVGIAVTARDSQNQGLGAEAQFADIRLGPSGPPPPTGVSFVRGDTNADGSVNIADASFLLNFLFLGGPDPKCMAAADGNADGGANIADASFILNFLFLGGRDIPAPNACGQEPKAEEADCASFPPCPQ